MNALNTGGLSLHRPTSQGILPDPINSAARDYQRSLIEEIARDYDVDGIVVDWVRFDDYNMDLGDDTRARFKASAGFDPIAIDFERQPATDAIECLAFDADHHHVRASARCA